MREIPQEQVLNRLSFENPWWRTPNEVQDLYSELRPRPYLALLAQLVVDSDVRRAVVVMGPRRVGKTVLIHHLIGEILKSGVNPKRVAYFSVDHPLYNGQSLGELLDAYRESTGIDYTKELAYVFFDEIQYLKGWEVHLKALVDDFPQLNATALGSAAAALRLKSAESGAGRFTDFLLPPLTFYEFLELLEEGNQVKAAADNWFVARDLSRLNELFIEYINYGGYPEVVLSQKIRQDPGRFVKADIVDKVLLRDLPSLYGIKDIQELNSLFTTLAFNTANEVSLQELSQRSGVAKNTIKRYIEYLEAAFLIRVVYRVNRNGKRFKRANFFKVYLTNPSIRCALFAPVEADDEVLGSLVETAIFAQWFHLSEYLLHYARWDGGEVDIVGLGPDQKARWCVEAKWSDRPVERREEVKNLASFCRANSISRSLVTTRSKRDVQKHTDLELEFMPASEYCYTVGRNVIRRMLRQVETLSSDQPMQMELAPQPQDPRSE